MEGRIKAIVAYVEVPYGGMDINLNTGFFLSSICNLESIKNEKSGMEVDLTTFRM
jgi:hypothetical protein